MAWFGRGTNSTNVIGGGWRNDPDLPFADNDLVVKGSGDDTIDTGAGDDTVFAGSGDDLVKTGRARISPTGSCSCLK